MFDWAQGIIETTGYPGLFFLMVLENIFPPIPSELIIPLAGYSSAQGDLNIFLTIIVATAGSVVGILPWYFLGYFFGIERLKNLSRKYGRVLSLSVKDIDTTADWFYKHGKGAVLFGRLIPTVRTLISVPAGMARMPFFTFLIFSAIGSALWTSLLASFGFSLESQHAVVGAYLNPVSDLIVVLFIGIYLYRVIFFKKED